MNTNARATQLLNPKTDSEKRDSASALAFVASHEIDKSVEGIRVALKMLHQGKNFSADIGRRQESAHAEELFTRITKTLNVLAAANADLLRFAENHKPGATPEEQAAQSARFSDELQGKYKSLRDLTGGIL